MGIFQNKENSTVLVSGTLLVTYIFACSRWGTHVSVGYVFISDVLFVSAIISFLISEGWRRNFQFKIGNPGLSFYVLLLFFGYFCLRFITSLGQGTLYEWLRDGVPFVYASLAFISALSVTRLNNLSSVKTYKFLRWGLSFHVCWTAVVTLTGNSNGFWEVGPLGTATAFGMRGDIDSALIAILVGTNLREAIISKKILWNSLGILIGVVVIATSSDSRAGFISLALAIVISLWLVSTTAQSDYKIRNRLTIVSIILIVISGIFIVTTSSGQRVLTSVFPELAAVIDDKGALGTINARELTWQGVFEWTSNSSSRALIGSGFGNDFLSESGTLKFLEGETWENVRSPHNWIVGIYARMGAIGVSLISWWMILIVRKSYLFREKISKDPLFSLSLITFSTLIPVSLLGVILEAPFGAIPFFWSAGLIMGIQKNQVNHFQNFKN